MDAAEAASTPLTPHQFELIKTHTNAAIRLENKAMQGVIKGTAESEKEASSALRDSATALHDTFLTFVEHGLDRSDAAVDLHVAWGVDQTAIREVGKEDLTEAQRSIYRGLREKAAALRLLPSLTIAEEPTSATGPTLSGEGAPGTIPGTIDLGLEPPSTGINDFRLADPGGLPIKERYAPQRWRCWNPVSSIVECRGPLIRTPFTTMLEVGGTGLSRLLVSASANRGKTFGRLTTIKIKGPTTTPPPPPATTTPSLTLSCSSSLPLYGDLQVSGTLAPPVAGASIVIAYTFPNGSTVRHTVPADGSTGAWRDSIGDPFSGVVVSQAFYFGTSQNPQNVQSPPCSTPVG